MFIKQKPLLVFTVTSVLSCMLISPSAAGFGPPGSPEFQYYQRLRNESIEIANPCMYTAIAKDLSALSEKDHGAIYRFTKDLSVLFNLELWQHPAEKQAFLLAVRKNEATDDAFSTYFYDKALATARQVEGMTIARRPLSGVTKMDCGVFVGSCVLAVGSTVAMALTNQILGADSLAFMVSTLVAVGSSMAAGGSISMILASNSTESESRRETRINNMSDVLKGVVAQEQALGVAVIYDPEVRGVREKLIESGFVQTAMSRNPALDVDDEASSAPFPDVWLILSDFLRR